VGVVFVNGVEQQKPKRMKKVFIPRAETEQNREIQSQQSITDTSSKQQDQINQKKLNQLNQLIKKEQEKQATRDVDSLNLNSVTDKLNNMNGFSFSDFNLDEMLKGKMDQILKSNPFSYMSKEQVKDFILARTKGSPLGPVLEKSPKLMEFLGSFFTDKEALPSLLNIIKRKQDLVNYSVFTMVCFVVAFFLSMQVGNQDGFAKKVFKKMGVRALPMILGLGLFLFLFKKELAPTLDIVKNTFF
jgi:small-conductance mechanosensitive channel